MGLLISMPTKSLAQIQAVMCNARLPGRWSKVAMLVLSPSQVQYSHQPALLLLPNALVLPSCNSFQHFCAGCLWQVQTYLIMTPWWQDLRGPGRTYPYSITASSGVDLTVIYGFMACLNQRKGLY